MIRRGLLPLALGLLPLASCLAESDPVDGRLLFAGPYLERPHFLPVEGAPWVMFDVRKARAELGRGGRLDTHLVRWEDGMDHLVLGDRAERPEWPIAVDHDGYYYYMTEERLAEGALALAVGTLTRVGLLSGVAEKIPDVTAYSFNGPATMFYYRVFVPGSPFQDFHLRDLEGTDRNLGQVSGSAQFFGDEGTVVYYVTGEERALMRVPGLVGEPKRLRNRVSRYTVRTDERYAIMSVSESNKVRTLVVDLQTLEERPLPVDNPCCWLSLIGDVFTFAESAKADTPAKLHRYNIVTQEDQVMVMPEGLRDVSFIMNRPGSNQALIFDSQRRFAVYRPDQEPKLELVALTPSAPAFSNDGRYLIYIEQDEKSPVTEISRVLAGKLLVQDADDFTRPPRLLSPRGSSVPISPQGYFFSGGGPYTLVFWAHYGLGASDLYFCNHESGEVVKVAEGISEVTVTQKRVLGIVRVSLQDVTGDLAQKDLTTGEEDVLAHSVSEMTINGDRLAFVVRERRPSSPRNGLWAITLGARRDAGAPMMEGTMVTGTPPPMADAGAPSASRGSGFERRQ
jgi:hypothetical protein